MAKKDDDETKADAARLKQARKQRAQLLKEDTPVGGNMPADYAPPR